MNINEYLDTIERIIDMLCAADWDAAKMERYGNWLSADNMSPAEGETFCFVDAILPNLKSHQERGVTYAHYNRESDEWTDTEDSVLTVFRFMLVPQEEHQP